MLARNLWKNNVQGNESGDLNELRRNTILEVASIIFTLAWAMMLATYGDPLRFIVPSILMVGATASISLREGHFRWARACLVGSLIIALSYQKALFPSTPAQFGFPIVVAVSSVLVSGISIFAVAAASSAALVTVAQFLGAEWLDEQLVIIPILFTSLTACAAWIGSRQIHLALDWMSRSYTRANEVLDQLRDERASLARTLKMLEDAYVRIEKMNYALIEARSTAENARQLKAEFAANISHELRTPLNLIIGFSEMMANAPEAYTGVTWTPALRGDIEQIFQSSRHLASLIDDILDLSALDARRLGLTLQEASIEDVISEAIAMMHDLFHAKQLSLNLQVEPGLPRVRMDATRIRQVLINLLTNASRFTPSGGVLVSARPCKEGIEVSVQDTGIGIATQDVAKVFEEFGQVDGSTTRKHEGSGLGVPLSKRLVESHGGRMWLTSERGKGTTFFFTLPRGPEGAGPSTVSTWSGSPSARWRKVVLVHEPDPLLLRTIRRHLGSYDVIAIGPEDDVGTLSMQHPCIALLTSVPLGKRPGWQIPDDLPVIQVALAGNVQAAKSLGVQDYIIKPVLRESLLDAMAHLEREVHNVLIVDDDPELVELIARMLQSAGDTYRPIKAYGGADALERLRGGKVDLMLLDLFMPGMDGMAVLKQVKCDPTLRQIPVIVISAQNPDAGAAQAGLSIHLGRTRIASTTETLNYLRALMGELPLRGLPATRAARA